MANIWTKGFDFLGIAAARTVPSRLNKQQARACHRKFTTDDK